MNIELDANGTGPDLAGLLQGCRDGDRASQQRLYEIYHQQVYRVIVRMVDRQDVDDVMQQVFLQVFRKIHLFEGHSKFTTWLFRVAKNEAFQHLRKRKRREAHVLTHEPVSHHRSEFARKEAKEVIDRALAQLDPELRWVFVLREIERLSYEEIAATVDIPEGTVGSRLNRARRELRSLVHSLGWEP